MEKNLVQTTNDVDQICRRSGDSHGVTSSRTESKEVKAPESTVEDEPEYLTGLKLIIVHISLTVASFLVLVDTSIVATATPHITNEFHSLSDVGWYGSAYLLANCALQPMSGKLYSIFHMKKCFLSFLALFEIGSIICGAATSSRMLIIGRAVAGLGAAGILNGILSINAASVPLEKRAALLGICLGLSQVGIVLGPLVGGALTEYTTWRWCFYINVPVGAVVAPSILLIYIPDRAAKLTRRISFISTLNSLDPGGFLLFASATIMSLLALQWGGVTYAWSSATVVGLFCGSAVALMIFIVWEYRRGDSAMIPLSILRQRVVWSCYLTILFITANWQCTSYWMSIYFQDIKATSPLTSGVYLLPTILSHLVLNIVAGILLSRLGYYLPYVVCGSILAAIGSGMLSTLTPFSSAGKWVGYQLLGGAGRGMAVQMPFMATQNAVSAAEISIAMGLLCFFQNLGAAVVLSLAQTVFLNGLYKSLPRFAPSVNVAEVVKAGHTGFRAVVPANLLPAVILAYNQAIDHVFYLVAGAGAAAAVCSLFMGWKSIKKAAPPAPEV